MLKETIKICVAFLVLIGAVGLQAKERVVLPPSWVNASFNYDVTVEELAKMYYGDSKDYIYILEANKDILRGSHLVRKKTEIRIPITPKFREIPQKLGWND
jgi:hypothetical protein